jgi:hypothetical protein
MSAAATASNRSAPPFSTGTGARFFSQQLPDGVLVGTPEGASHDGGLAVVGVETTVDVPAGERALLDLLTAVGRDPHPTTAFRGAPASSAA